jgi:eukaryotic-like serine/threonine-protein kinase
MPGSAISDLAGRVLAGRYLLHNAIGTGASGRVYVADDTRLRRRVAVKVLHAALADDAAFLRRFRAEAQLAASLHHPHIVTVHDWGEDDVPFMVLELLEGGSLRSMLDTGSRLSLAQTARIGRDVASALEYAHSRGVLHRDIKPANLLFDEHGIVRVADFGLARALAEASLTEPAGAVFGTARYASPEQARGVRLDGRSDLYSLALVLVESVTGSVPFAADTTIGTLTARTQQPLTAPPELGALAPVVERAGALDVADRYPDAATMRAAIADAADAMPPPAPLPLAGMIDRADPNPTRAVPGSTLPLFDQDRAVVEPVLEPAVDAELVVEPDRKRRPREQVQGQRRLVPFVVAIVLLVTVAIATAALARVSGSTPLPVPSLVGLTEARATDAARQAGLAIANVAQRSAPDAAGTVIDQTPRPGAFSGSHRVNLVVSKGPPDVAVPMIIGEQWSQAQPQLDAVGIVYNKQEKYDETHEAGIVVSAAPTPGVFVRPGTTVVVTVSLGHAPVAIPDVSKLSYDDAAAKLTALKFVVKPADKPEFSATVPIGKVTRTDPPSTSPPVAYGSTITVFVSKGPDLVKVPDVTFETLAQARVDLAAAGLTVGTVVNDSGETGVVMDQSPRGGKLPRGSSVDLVLKRHKGG